MLVSEQPRKKADRHDVRWMFTHKDRCHICGGLIREGDHYQTGDVRESYTPERGKRTRLFTVQWHIDCVSEVTQQ